MKCLCIGICQLGAMVEILKKSKVFTSIYDTIVFYPVYEISIEKMNSIIENEIPNSNLILSQPVSNTYKGTDLFSSKKLRELAKIHNIKHYIISNCYFTGYDPIPFQLTNSSGEIIFINGVSYIPSACLEDLIRNDVLGACRSWCNPDLYIQSELDRNLSLTLTELYQREQQVFDNDFGIDIKIADYIDKNFRQHHLFHTYNHPTNLVLFELIRRLFDRLSLPYDDVKVDRELLGDYSIPPPPSVYFGYKMTFKYPDYKIGAHVCRSTIDAMRKYNELMQKANPDLHERWRSVISSGRAKIAYVS